MASTIRNDGVMNARAVASAPSALRCRKPTKIATWACQGPRHCLPQCDAVEEVLSAHPFALLYHVALHVTDSGDWPTESKCTQLKKVDQQPFQRWRLDP